MKISLASLIIGLVWILKPNEANAQYLKCSKNPVHIHYLNGMFNSKSDAENSKKELFNFMTIRENRSKVSWTGTPTVDFSHNRSYLREAGYSDENKFKDAKSSLLTMMDLLEVADQKLQNYAEAYGIEGIYTWEEIAASYYGLKYTTKHPASKLVTEVIASLIKSQMTYKAEDAQRMVDNLRPYRDSEDKVIIVSHSQGNLHANETFLRLFPDFQADYPFQRPLDISNPSLIGNLWGNFQVASPTLIISNPRYKSMRFRTDRVFGPLGQPLTNDLIKIPDGLPDQGTGLIAPDNDTNSHTFLLYTSDTYTSAKACIEGPCPDTTKTNREHFIDRMQEVAEMLPSNCGEVTADGAFEIVENTLSKRSKLFVKNYSKVKFDPDKIIFGSTISDLDDSQKSLLVSSYDFNGAVASDCVNVDDNPYFCDSEISRSIASVTIDREVQNSRLTVSNTFNETYQLHARDYLPSGFQVYNGNEDIFAPSLTANVPATVNMSTGMDSKYFSVTVSAVDDEFTENSPKIYRAVTPTYHNPYSIGSGEASVDIGFFQKPNAPDEELTFYFAAEGLFGAKKFIEKKVVVDYCDRDDCCVDQGEGLSLGKFIWSDMFNSCKLKAPPEKFLDYRCDITHRGFDEYGKPIRSWEIIRVYESIYEYFMPQVNDYMGYTFAWGGPVYYDGSGSFDRDINVRYSNPVTGEAINYWRNVRCSY